MRTLYVGLSGGDVEKWEHFLLGQDPMCDIVVDGVFDLNTRAATIAFQKRVGFVGSSLDGIVGPGTLGKAMSLGFNPLDDDRRDDQGPNWPPKPDNVGPLTPAQRESLFGKFAFKATPVPLNPEAIDILGDWEAKNIVTVSIPQLAGLSGASKSGNVACHRAISTQIIRLFNDWEEACKLDLIISWGGLWVPRFVRGSRTSLSNHSWGTAFDINVPWNALGTQGALKDEHGSVRDLVEIAYANGFFWGGWYAGRKDPMHFEAFKVI